MAQYYADYDDDDYGAIYAGAAGSDQHLPIDPDDYYDLDIEPGASLPQFSTAERLYGCILPTSHQFADMITTYVLTNLMFAFATQFLVTSGRGQHLIAIVCGNVVLHYTYGTDGVSRIWAVVLGAVLVFKACCWRRTRRMGYTVSVVCVGMLLAGEVFEADVRAWHRLRGTMLLVAMKAVSVAFDAETTSRDARPGLVQLVGYLMSPATCVFGPWCRFSDYMAAFVVDKEWRFSFRWFRHIIANTVAAFVCLIASNCLIAAVIADDANRWLAAYRDAMIFRFSHYFVSYLGQTMLVTGSASPVLYDGPLGGGSWLLGLRTVEPLYVEVPRSLVRVVVVWNRSMHFWLKTYVFRVIRPHGTFAAILGTYAVSALLHGLNFQLSAVLLSLGLFTYVEHNVRSRLASIFNACVLASSCRSGCGHRYTWRHPYVLAFNGLQSALAVWHLAYLGLMFAGEVEAEEVGDEMQAQEVGYSWTHTLGRWASLHFVSHWLVAAVFVCFKLV